MLSEDCSTDASVVPEAQYASLQCQIEVRMCQQAASNVPRPCQNIEGDREKWSVQSVQLCDTVHEVYVACVGECSVRTAVQMHRWFQKLNTLVFSVKLK